MIKILTHLYIYIYSYFFEYYVCLPSISILERHILLTFNNVKNTNLLRMILLLNYRMTQVIILS